MNKLFLLYILLSPFYFFPSGLPQLADLIMVIFILVCLLNLKWYKNDGISIMGLLLIYIVSINFIYTFLSNDLNPLIFNLYYIYNFFVMFACYIYFKQLDKKNFMNIFYAFMITLIIQLVFIILLNDSSLRSANFFDKPNQLAYFILLLMTIMVLFSFRFKLSLKYHFTPYIFSIYIVFMTGSRGALAGILALLVIHYLLVEITMRKILLLFIISSVFIVIYEFRYLLLASNNQLSSILNRIITKSSEDELLGDRGYQRVIENSELLIFGAGEGYASRLGYRIELHSLFGTILFSYGLIGTLIFIFFALKLTIMMRIHVLLLSGVILYNFSHNGIRTTLLWILFSAILVFYHRTSVKYQTKVNDH